jgi:cupin fold WbuC family metalloprotein
MIQFDNNLLNKLTEAARQSSRLRMNHNFHSHPNAQFQRMLNAIEPDSYIRPHKHENPDKSEAFIVLRGKMAVITFDDTGAVLQAAVLSPEGPTFGLEIPPRTWHTIISLESGSVAYEAKDGPYNPDTDKHFASWAPEEGSREALDVLFEYKNLPAIVK